MLLQDRLRAAAVCRAAQATALAAGGELVVWTPAAGRRFRLRQLAARASAAGRYEVRDGAAVMVYGYLEANRWTVLLDLTAEVHGCLSEAAGSTLRFRNGTGGPADVDVLAIGNEE